MKVALVDYQLGNIRSMAAAIEHLGHEPLLDGDGSDFGKASVLIIPGVGEFGTGIRKLRDTGLDEAIVKHGSSGKPVVGVCLGAQMLLTGSDENPECGGLDLVPGWASALNSRLARVPNQGWWLTRDYADEGGRESYYYYSHSFHCEMEDPTSVCQRIVTHPERPVGSYQYLNFTGIQFHPERSGREGLNYLRSLLNNFQST